MKPLASWPDVEPQIRVLLTDALTDEDITAGIGVPPDWEPASDPHLEVAWDGTPIVTDTLALATVRIVVRAATTGEAKRLALLAQAHLLTDPSITPLVGVQPVRDPDTRAELAWFTVRVARRSALI